MYTKEKDIMEPIDLTVILADYSKKWVVLSFDETEVLKAGETYDEVREFADKGITMLVPDYQHPYAP